MKKFLRAVALLTVLSLALSVMSCSNGSNGGGDNGGTGSGNNSGNGNGNSGGNNSGSSNENPFKGKTLYDGMSQKFVFEDNTVNIYYKKVLVESSDQRTYSDVPEFVYEYTVDAENKTLTWKVIKISGSAGGALISLDDYAARLNSDESKKNLIEKMGTTEGQKAFYESHYDDIVKTMVGGVFVYAKYNYIINGSDFELTELFDAERARFSKLNNSDYFKVDLIGEIASATINSNTFYNGLPKDGKIVFYNWGADDPEKDLFEATYAVNKNAKTMQVTYNKDGEKISVLDWYPNSITLKAAE